MECYDLQVLKSTEGEVKIHMGELGESVVANFLLWECLVHLGIGIWL